MYNLIHSLNTEKSIVNKSYDLLFMHVNYFFLSCLYAKMNGFHITLHTDEFGAELLKNAPYDNIIVDIKKPADMSDKFFAWPKFIALENSPIDSIHIDGDVMLRNPNIKYLLWKETDVVCQCEENRLVNKLYGGGYDISSKTFKNCWYPEWANRNCDIMYNTGVIGLFNKDLRREWIDTYWKMTKEFNENGQYIDKAIPDIIIEQQFLRDLIVAKNYKVNFIINEKKDFNKMNSEASQKGYLHVMNDKYNFLQKCVNRIIQINPFFGEEIIRIQNILGVEYIKRK